MCNYSIKNYTIEKAKIHGLTVKPSTRKGTKVDVYKNNIYIASIGSIDYSSSYLSANS